MRYPRRVPVSSLVQTLVESAQAGAPVGKQDILQALWDAGVAIRADAECIDEDSAYSTFIRSIDDLVGGELGATSFECRGGDPRVVAFKSHGKAFEVEVDGRSDYVDIDALQLCLNQILAERGPKRLCRIWDQELFGQDFALAYLAPDDSDALASLGLPIHPRPEGRNADPPPTPDETADAFCGCPAVKLFGTPELEQFERDRRAMNRATQELVSRLQHATGSVCLDALEIGSEPCGRYGSPVLAAVNRRLAAAGETRWFVTVRLANFGRPVPAPASDLAVLVDTAAYGRLLSPSNIRRHRYTVTDPRTGDSVPELFARHLLFVVHLSRSPSAGLLSAEMQTETAAEVLSREEALAANFEGLPDSRTALTMFIVVDDDGAKRACIDNALSACPEAVLHNALRFHRAFGVVVR